MLSRRDIEKELGKGINLHPLRLDNIKENSINLTISKYAWASKSAVVYWYGDDNFSMENKDGQFEKIVIKKGELAVKFVGKGKNKAQYLILPPHSTANIETKEVIAVSNNIGGALHSKVGIAAKGIAHIGTMLGPGYCGHLLISIHNITDEVVALKVGTTFVSLSFDYLTTQVARTSSTVSGHIDKFPELGIKINSEIRKHLDEDWKSNIDGIRKKMISSEEYKKFLKYKKENRWQEIKKYINKRNVISTGILLGVFVGLYILAYVVDSRTGVTIWQDRFWTVGFSGVLGTILANFFSFLKDKK